MFFIFCLFVIYFLSLLLDTKLISSIKISFSNNFAQYAIYGIEKYIADSIFKNCYSCYYSCYNILICQYSNDKLSCKMIMQFFVEVYEFKMHVDVASKYKYASIVNSHRTMYYTIAHVYMTKIHNNSFY